MTHYPVMLRILQVLVLEVLCLEGKKRKDGVPLLLGKSGHFDAPLTALDLNFRLMVLQYLQLVEGRLATKTYEELKTSPKSSSSHVPFKMALLKITQQSIFFFTRNSLLLSGITYLTWRKLSVTAMLHRDAEY